MNVIDSERKRTMEIYSRLFIAKSGNGTPCWLPLWMHHMDTYVVMRYLFDEFVSDSIAESCAMEINELKKTALFAALVHDIGKATVGFQYKIGLNAPERKNALERCLDIPESMDPDSVRRTPHSFAGEAILKLEGCPGSIAEVIGTHHGVPAENSEEYDLTCDRKDIIGYRNYYGDTEETRLSLESAWKSIVGEALDKAGFENTDALPILTLQAQMILTGLLITADWIASNTEYFPLISIDDDGYEIDYEERADKALDALGFPEMWSSERTAYGDNEFEEVFGFLPSVVQKRVLEIVRNTAQPGLFILEAPMGCGKTEAALSSAELIASKCKKNGLFFGMPTQATANGIFPRIINWAEKQSEEFYHSVSLRHGSAELNEAFRNIQRGIPEESDSGVIVHSWFCDSKRACLADFVTATVDQIAVMRLLLAVLHTVYSRVDENGDEEPLEEDEEEEALERWKAIWERGSFFEKAIGDYLDKWHERFWLFHPERPFGQVAGMKIGTDYDAPKLNGEISESSNGLTIFRRSCLFLSFFHSLRMLLTTE